MEILFEQPLPVFDQYNSKKNKFLISNGNFPCSNLYLLPPFPLLCNSKQSFFLSSLYPLIGSLKTAIMSFLLFLRLNRPSSLSLSLSIMSSSPLTSMVASTGLPPVCQCLSCTVEPQTRHTTLDAASQMLKKSAGGEKITGVCFKAFAKVKVYNILCHFLLPSSSLLAVGSNLNYFEIVTIQSQVK